MPIRWAVWEWVRTDHLTVLRTLLIACSLCSAVLIVMAWSIIATIHRPYSIYQNFRRLPAEGKTIHYRNLMLQCLENNLMVKLTVSCIHVRKRFRNSNIIIFDSAVGMVKAPTSESTEFTMSNEDFPALPGTQPTIVSENSSVTPSASVSGSSSSLSSDHKLMNHDSSSQSEQILSSNSRIGSISAAPGAEKHQHGLHQNKKGIQTFPEGLCLHFHSLSSGWLSLQDHSRLIEYTLLDRLSTCL